MFSVDSNAQNINKKRQIISTENEMKLTYTYTFCDEEIETIEHFVSRV